MKNESLDQATATAILGIDTLWGGDVMNPSGTGRFIADSWFSDEPLPAAYTHPTAKKVRESGGVSAKQPDKGAIDAYLSAVDVKGAIDGMTAEGRKLGGLRGGYFEGLGTCFLAMWDLVQEILGRGEPVPYERCVIGSTGKPPEPSHPETKRGRGREVLGRAGYPSGNGGSLLTAVDSWRRDRMVPGASIPMLADALIAQFSAGTAKHLAPHLPSEIEGVPLANMKFLPIKDAWFSVSMTYLGRARKPDGSPEYEATYEINASLQISVPEFAQLVSHEVVPGHVTSSADVQARHVRGRLGFEPTGLTMNSRRAALMEDGANTAFLIAHGVTEVEDLPSEDLQIGVLLALLQDDAKNQSSWLTWKEGAAQKDVAGTLRREYLVSEERADKLSGAWGRHPLLGRMYLPAYRAGTERVAALRKAHPPVRVLPVLYGCKGLVDVVTVAEALGPAS